MKALTYVKKCTMESTAGALAAVAIARIERAVVVVVGHGKLGHTRATEPEPCQRNEPLS